MAEVIIVPRRREDFFDEQGNPTHRFIRWIELVTGQTNSSSIIIETTEQELVSNNSRTARNAVRINSLELKEFEIVKPLADFTTDKNQILICKNTTPIAVTLDPNAIEDDELHIKRRGKKINIIGLVDGKSNPVISINLFSMHLVFDGIDWSQI